MKYFYLVCIVILAQTKTIISTICNNGKNSNQKPNFLYQESQQTNYDTYTPQQSPIYSTNHKYIPCDKFDTQSHALSNDNRNQKYKELDQKYDDNNHQIYIKNVYHPLQKIHEPQIQPKNSILSENLNKPQQKDSNISSKKKSCSKYPDQYKVGTNTIIGVDDTVKGTNNLVKGSTNEILGNRNKVRGLKNTVQGQQNKIHGNKNAVIGSNNIISGSGNIVISDCD